MINSTFLKKHIYKYKFHLFFLIVLNLILRSFIFLNTYFTGKYIDILVYKLTPNSIYIFALVIFTLGMLKIIFGYINNYFTMKIQTNLCFDINFSLLKHIKKLPESFFREIDSVYLNQRVNSDSNSVINFSISIIIKSIALILFFLFIFLVIKNTDTFIMYITLLIVPLYIILYFLFRKKLYKVTRDYKENQNKFFSIIHKHLNNINYVKLNCLFDKLDEKTINSYPFLLKSILRQVKYSYTFASLKSVLENIFNIFLFLYGGFQIFNNKMTVGEFIAIKGYYSMIMSIISEFASVVESYPDALVSYNRLMEILNTNKEFNGNEIINKIELIETSNLNVSINNTSILNKFSYTFKKGNIYLINGSNGAGKSTLVKSILGLYINDFQGIIKYNNYNIKDIDIYKCRKNNIAIIDQESELIFSSLYENLLHNIEIDKINFTELDKLIKLFNLDIDISEIKNGKNTHRKFSGGEKQKIALIRAFLKNPDFIVMDEPTSALDSHSVNILINKIKEIKSNKIIIIISHDARINAIADEVVNLDCI